MSERRPRMQRGWRPLGGLRPQAPAAAPAAAAWETRRRLAALTLALGLGGPVAATRPQEATIHTAVEGEPLPEVSLVRSSNGALHTTLMLGAARVEGPNVSLATRVFNGSIPGPTLAVHPGNTLSILFANDLQAPLGFDAHNNFHYPNITNLHVHGLHVSSRSPGDNVLDIAMRPGEAFRYEYKLPAHHSPGTYWVHPHYHGSAVLQSGAGAAGALLVLDPPGFLSPQLAAMPDRVLMLQAFPRKMLQKAAKISQDNLFHVDHWNWGQELWLVNGVPRPVISMKPLEWQRLRLVAAGVSTWLHMDFGACEVALLAKDGVYIDDFPRPVRRVSLPQGGRADVAVRCAATAGARGGDHEVTSVAPAVHEGARAFVGPLFTLRVEGTAAEGAATGDLQAWAPPSRPPYLQDLRSVGPAACSCSTSLGIGGNTRWMEGHLWVGNAAYMHVSPFEAIVERRLSGLDLHPYHAHTYPFQLLTSPDGGDPYFRGGDWHDTYFNVRDSRATVRFRTADFYGPQVVHCHNPVHSDQGMIAVELVARGRGPGHCGCDILTLDEEQGSRAARGSAEERSQVLLSAAIGVFLIMLTLAGGISVQLVRACRQAGAAELGYTTLAKGPNGGQEAPA